MADLMIDIETAATTPDACILTIAAQSFNPLSKGYYERSFYRRITIESQAKRHIDDATIKWWSSNPDQAGEAFAEEGRVSLRQALEELSPIIWQSKRVWAQGPTFDMTILENAYKSLDINKPWQYFNVRDSRTVLGLCPGLASRPATHHALDDCRRQIDLIQEALATLNIRQLK